MSEASQAISALRRPRSLIDLLAILLAFVTVILAMEAFAFIDGRLKLFDEEVRKYIMGVGFAGFMPIHDQLRLALKALPAGATPGTEDRHAWLRTGLKSGALVFVAQQAVALYASVVIGTMLAAGHVTATDSLAQAIANGISLLALPAAGFAALHSGYRFTQTNRAFPTATFLTAGFTFAAATAVTAWAAMPMASWSTIAAASPLTAAGYVLFHLSTAVVIALVCAAGMLIAALLHRGPTQPQISGEPS